MATTFGEGGACGTEAGIAGIFAEDPGLRGGAVGGNGAVLRSVPGMTGGFTRSVCVGSEGGEVGAAGALAVLGGAVGSFGAEGIAGAMRAVVSAMDGAIGAGSGLGAGVETVAALDGAPAGFIADGGPGGGGGEAAGRANCGGGIFEVSGGAAFGGIGDFTIALPGLREGAGAIMVAAADGGFIGDGEATGGPG